MADLMMCGERPKSLEKLSLKLPDALVAFIDEARAQHAPVQSRSDFVKGCIEFRGIISMGHRLGFYTLRERERNVE